MKKFADQTTKLCKVAEKNCHNIVANPQCLPVKQRMVLHDKDNLSLGIEKLRKSICRQMLSEDKSGNGCLSFDAANTEKWPTT